MHARVIALALFGASMGAPAPAQDAMLDLSTPETFAAALQGAGYKAQLKKDDKGEPYILSSVNGSEFTVDFYECKLGKCSSAQITSWYKPDPLFTLALVNEWNNGYRFLRVGLNDTGRLREFLDITTVGTVSKAQFADMIDWYAQMDNSFARFLDTKRKSTGETGTKPKAP